MKAEIYCRLCNLLYMLSVLGAFPLVNDNNITCCNMTLCIKWASVGWVHHLTISQLEVKTLV